MPQTPKSASVVFSSTTPTTIYTVPSGATAVVKSVLSASAIGGFPSVTINKVSGGVTYPITVNAPIGYQATSGTGFAYPGDTTLNLLNGPITLAAGESISISTSTAGQYKFPAATFASTSPGFKIANINYVNGFYVAVGFDSVTGFGLILTSPDGNTWTRRTFNNAINLTDIAFGNGFYVVVGRNSGNRIFHSTDLATWTARSIPNYNLNCVTFGNGKFVAGGNGGRALYTATNDPTSTWTAVLMNANSQEINTVLTIGTTWAFGSAGEYSYTTDLVTYTMPYYPYESVVGAGGGTTGYTAVDSAGNVFATLQNPTPSTNPNETLFRSTNQGRSFTAVTLPTAGTVPTQVVRPFFFGNGSEILWMTFHPGNSRYVNSTDGVTWTNQNFTGTNATQLGTWYNRNLYNLTTAVYNGFWAYTDSNNNVNLLQVDSSGIVSNGVAFSNSGSNINMTNDGVMTATGNASTGAWMAMGINPSGLLAAQWYGSSMTNGSNGQTANNLFDPNSWGNPCVSCTRPGSNGFIVGTRAGYFLASSSTTGGYAVMNGTERPWGNTSIVGLAVDGNLSTSKIVMITSDGKTAYSVNQGNDWTEGGRIQSANFESINYGTQTALTYGGGVWLAQNDNGAVWSSTDGINWVGNPFNMQYMASVNSKNIMLQTVGGVYTDGTSVDVFNRIPSTFNFSTYPSIRRIQFVSGRYLLSGNNAIISSTDLVSFVSNSFSSTQINNVQFISIASGSAVALAYSGSGGNLVAGNALRSSSVDNANISTETLAATALTVGTTTAGIVEIS